MPAQLPPLDPAGRWITVGGHRVHTDSDGVVDGGGYPGMKTGSPVYDGFPGAARRDLGAEPKLPKALVAHAGDWANSLSSDELSAVGKYTGEGYKLVNGAAKACPQTLDCFGLRGHKLYERMQSAIKKAGDLPRPVVAYRGFRSTPARKEDLLRAARGALHTGGTMTLPGFQSLSLNPVTASMFAGMTGHRERDNPSGGLVFEVKCKSGAPVGWTDQVSMFGDNEQEIVLNHNCNYKVTGIKNRVPFGTGGTTHTVVQLEQVDDGSTAAPKNPKKSGWRGVVQEVGAVAADLIGLSDDEVVLSPETVAILSPVVAFGFPPPFPPKGGKAPFPPKGGKPPFPPKGVPPKGGKPPFPPKAVPPGAAAGADAGKPFHVQIKKHQEAVAKNKEALDGGGLPGHGNGPIAANEKSLRDTHGKIGDHLAKRAMGGQWGPAEDGLQRMHEHLTGVLAQHDAHHAKKHQEAEQIAHHEASQKAGAEAEAAAAEEAANAPPPEPDLHPAERLALEARERRRAKKKKKKKKLEKLLAGRDKNRPELAGLPASVRASIASKNGEAPAPKVIGEGDEDEDEDDEDDDKGKGKGKDKPFGKKSGGKPFGKKSGDEDEDDDGGDKDRDEDDEDDKDRAEADHEKPGKPHGDKLGPTPSTEEQANAVLPYKVKLRVALTGHYGLTTQTNSGVDARKLTKKVREAADPAKLKGVADRRGTGTRDAVVERVAKVLCRPLSSGEADLVDPARPGVLSVRPDGGLVKETRAGTWITPDRFAPPEFVPHASGLMPGSYGYASYGPAVAGAETGSGAVRSGAPGAPDAPGHVPEKAPDHGVVVGVVEAGGQKLYVPLGADHRPLTHQHFTDRRSADLVGKATATGAIRTKLHFDRPKREWLLLHLHPTRGWVEVRRFKEGHEAKAEHHLRHALHADLAHAGHDAGVPSHAAPATPHGVGATRVGPDTLYHPTAPDGVPVGELYRERETAELAAKALSRGVCDTRLRSDGERWLIETATGHGWKSVKSYPDHRPKAAEKHFRKRLREDLDRDDEPAADEREVGGTEIDSHFTKGYKRAKRAGRHAGDGSDVAPALSRHVSGVIHSAYAKLRARFGDATARAIVASGFAQETHGAGLGRKGPAAFADLDPTGRWVTTASGKHMHIGGDGSPDAGNPHVVGAAKGGGTKGKPGTGGNPLPQPAPTNPASPPANGSGRPSSGKSSGKSGETAPAKTGAGWGSWLAALGGGAAVAAATRAKSEGRSAPLVRNPSERASAGRSGGGRSGGGGKPGKGGKGGGSAGQGRFNKATLVSLVDFLKKVQTGGVDTTGHGNTAVNIGFSADPVVFGLPLSRKKYRLTDRHIKALGRILMEEVRGAVRRAALTRPDLHAAQERHEAAGSPKTPKATASFSGETLAARVREAPGSLTAGAARALVEKLEAIIPARLLAESRVRDLEIYPDQTGTQRRADETQREGVKGVRGFFDRHTGLMVVSVVGSDCHNFYHELGHSFDHLLDADDWDRIAAEWGGKPPENFAQAFTDLCMALRAGAGARREFARRKPAVCTIVARHGLPAAAFAIDHRTRVARALWAARALAEDLAGLTVGGADYRAARARAGVRTADAVAQFAAAVAPAAHPAAASAATAAFAGAAADLLDALDDVIHAAGLGTPQPPFAAAFADRFADLTAAALAAAVGLAKTLPPAAAARELATAVAFGWQDEVRDAQGKWSTSGGGSSGESDSAPDSKSAAAGPGQAPDRVRSLLEAEPDRSKLPARDQLPALPPPPPANSHPTVIREWAKQVSAHPYVKEAERLVQAAKDAGATTGNIHWDPDAAGGKGDFTPARKELHDQIAGHVLNPAAAAGPGERPRVAFVLGPPGSGKTSMGRPAARAAMGLSADKVTTLDPDEVKMSLPEYKGWNAALVHDESAEVFDRLLERAVTDKHHVVFDTTGRSEEFMKSMLDKFAKAGYDAHLVHTHLSGEESARRAVNRFVDQAFQESADPEKRGRYVPVGFIAEHIDGHPQRVYDKLREDDRVKSWVSYDANDMKSGKILSSGTRDSAPAKSAAAA